MPVASKRSATSSRRVVSLKGDRAFARLRRGRPGHSRLLSLRWLPNRHAGRAIITTGIVVNKKVGNAVVRNRVRRRLRAALEAIVAECMANCTADTPPESATKALLQGIALVVIARPDTAQADYWQLKAALQRALSKAGLL